MSMQLLLSQIATVLACEQPKTDVLVSGAVIDSRNVENGSLFIALQGEHVDGHDYIATARLAGASAALVSVKQDDELPQLVVADVKKAFADVVTFWRQQCMAHVIAVTGSNGKTTVKEMLASILRQCGTVIATQGNLNNELGVPLTLSRVSLDTDYAVIEMGANHAGEINQLVAMARPDIALINNVASAHLEGFNSIEGVAKAKAEIFSKLSEKGVGILNADMPFVNEWKQVLTNNKVVTFSLDTTADITANDIQLDLSSSHFMVEIKNEFHYINLPLPGRHNISNALAAIAITTSLNIPVSSIVKGLALMKPVPHRMQFRTGVNQSQLIDDSYNANLGSYQQALKVLASFSGERWLVLGDFGELGTDSKQLHSKMGLEAKQSGVTKLLTIGHESKLAAQSYGEGSQHFNSISEISKQLKSSLSANVTCLIKGSRFMQLDKLADLLADEGED